MAHLVDVADVPVAAVARLIRAEGPGPNPLLPGGPLTADDAAELVADLRAAADGRGLPEGHVPASTYWLVEDDEIIGVGRLRHRLTPALRVNGGHAGGAIAASLRGRGYGNLVLHLTLRMAADHGIDTALVTCVEGNDVAIRSVISLGGREIVPAFDPAIERTVRRFCFDVHDLGPPPPVRPVGVTAR